MNFDDIINILSFIDTTHYEIVNNELVPVIHNYKLTNRAFYAAWTLLHKELVVDAEFAYELMRKFDVDFYYTFNPEFSECEKFHKKLIKRSYHMGKLHTYHYKNSGDNTFLVPCLYNAIRDNHESAVDSICEDIFHHIPSHANAIIGYADRHIHKFRNYEHLFIKYVKDLVSRQDKTILLSDDCLNLISRYPELLDRDFHWFHDTELVRIYRASNFKAEIALKLLNNDSDLCLNNTSDRLHIIDGEAKNGRIEEIMHYLWTEDLYNYWLMDKGANLTIKYIIELIRVCNESDKVVLFPDSVMKSLCLFEVKLLLKRNTIKVYDLINVLACHEFDIFDVENYLSKVGVDLSELDPKLVIEAFVRADNPKIPYISGKSFRYIGEELGLDKMKTECFRLALKLRSYKVVDKYKFHVNFEDHSEFISECDDPCVIKIVRSNSTLNYDFIKPSVIELLDPETLEYISGTGTP